MERHGELAYGRGPDRFLRRLRAALPDEAQRAGRVISTARAFLAVASLLAIYLDSTEPSRYAPVAYALLIAYVLYSLFMLALHRVEHGFGPRSQLLQHGVDVLWASLITFMTAGPNSPFYMFFLFVLLAAAYRWGLHETLTTAGIVAAVLMVQASVLSFGLPGGVPEPLGEFDVNRFIMRSAYVLVMGFLLGYLAEEDKYARAETAYISRIIPKLQAGRGLRSSLQTVLHEILQLYDASLALLALQDSSTGQLFLWEARVVRDSLPVLHVSELDPSRRELYASPGRVGGCFVESRSDPDGAAPVTRFAVDEQGRRLRNPEPAVPPDFPSAHPFRSLLVASFTFGGTWSGRLFLMDPLPEGPLSKKVSFLASLLREVSPSVYNVYLMRRLRSRIGAVERARAARELHDGAIQSLLAVEMKVDVLRRQPQAEPDRMAAELERVQHLLRNEIWNLRELMQQMKPVDLGPRQFLEFLADTTERFQRETGIAARFVSDLDEATLPARAATELGRILQEALVNVRKHSGAQNVVVRFTSSEGDWHLVIEDDGRGFDFTGRRSLAELDSLWKGPLVIKERVRSMGAELAIESRPGAGARLEITLPRRVHG